MPKRDVSSDDLSASSTDDEPAPKVIIPCTQVSSNIVPTEYRLVHGTSICEMSWHSFCGLG